MGLCLIAFNWSDPVWIWNVLKVVIGLGMVIFVHELGHFLVAKLCGVKCEKFYLGFDIGGLKLWKFRRGETEYGIGILPLGGYVKMLGQEDNPARLREEMERAKASQASVTEANSAAGGASAPFPSQEPGRPPEAAASGESPSFDPRSFLAKSVPKRMAIISAGVAMNVLFALFTAVWAYWLGLYEVECGAGGVTPGGPAWKTNLRVGDRITRIGDSPVDRYKDLKVAISVGDIDEGVPMVIERPGDAQPLAVTVHPKKTKPYPTIGILPPMSTVLSSELPALPGTAAARARPEFLPGDRIVAIDGQPIENYAQIHRALALGQDRALSFTVEGKPPSRNDRGEGPRRPAGQRATIPVAAVPVRHLGMVMEMGKVTAVQGDSPAQAAGIMPGDLITEVDGGPVGDPLALPDRLRRRAAKGTEQQTVALTITREGSPQPLALPVRLRRVDWYERAFLPGNPESVPALGIAYEVANRVAEVEPGSPAASAGIKPGDTVVQADLVDPSDEAIRALDYGDAFLKLGLKDAVTIDFKKEPNAWPSLFEAMQRTLLPGGTVELQLGDTRVVKLQPAEARDWFYPERGFLFEPKTFFSGGKSFDLALRLGTRETIDSMTIVYRVLEKLSTRQVSPTMLQGPVGIFETAYYFASLGFAELLIFLTIIGANLAVVNFLPIPVLDGGHMVFLLYEGITGKPPGEKIYVALTYLGLFFILGLMIWVFGLDISRLLSR